MACRASSWGSICWKSVSVFSRDSKIQPFFSKIIYLGRQYSKFSSFFTKGIQLSFLASKTGLCIVQNNCSTTSLKLNECNAVEDLLDLLSLKNNLSSFFRFFFFLSDLIHFFLFLIFLLFSQSILLNSFPLFQSLLLLGSQSLYLVKLCHTIISECQDIGFITFIFKTFLLFVLLGAPWDFSSRPPPFAFAFSILQCKPLVVHQAPKFSSLSSAHDILNQCYPTWQPSYADNVCVLTFTKSGVVSSWTFSLKCVMLKAKQLKSIPDP